MGNATAVDGLLFFSGYLRARLRLGGGNLRSSSHVRICSWPSIKRRENAARFGCGNGSIPAWLAERISPSGTAVAVDLDLSLIHVGAPNLELREADIVAGPIERGTFDLVTARAVLHHIANAQAAITNMVAGLKPGGALRLIEPDFLPVSVAEPPDVRAF